jgi:retron-type reverse transcriptase
MATRQELYDRIQKSSKEDVILEEMLRLGFWPRELGRPEDTREELERRKQLQAELQGLTARAARLQDLEKAKKELRQKRMQESRERQKETKLRRLRERQERAEAWRARKSREILYLGEGVSCGLNARDMDADKLRARGLPVLGDSGDLARAMGITIGELRFLSFARRVATVSHYRRFQIPKKTGGLRTISAPMTRLKRAQEWVLAAILEKVELHRAAHGFRKGRSIVTNAAPHVGAEVVVNLDLEQFFPTVTRRRIKGMFRSFGYGEQVATILSLICSEPEVRAVELDGRVYHVARGERHLPQGAPSSPAITNILCRGLDARLARIAEGLGFRYTRYADDMTFSGSGPAAEDVGKLLRRVRFVIEREGFRVHPEKTRILRKGRQQEVTGLVVNSRVNVARETLRRFRATLFQIERDGPAGKRWGAGPDVLAAIEGFANFVAMVDPERGGELRRRVGVILERYGH